MKNSAVPGLTATVGETQNGRVRSQPERPVVRADLQLTKLLIADEFIPPSSQPQQGRVGYGPTAMSERAIKNFYRGSDDLSAVQLIRVSGPASHMQCPGDLMSSAGLDKIPVALPHHSIGSN